MIEIQLTIDEVEDLIKTMKGQITLCRAFFDNNPKANEKRIAHLEERIQYLKDKIQ
jgi:hypothetical protein